MAAEFPLPIPDDPSIAIGFIWDLLAFVTPIPSPLDLILSLFAGRPTMAATYDIAHGLITQPSPPLVLLGIGAAWDLQHGIPLSTGNPNPVFGNYFSQAVTIESVIRFNSTDTNSMALSASTLKECLYEAGNPGASSNATIAAVNQAWTQLTPTQQANIRAVFPAAAAPGSPPIRNPPAGVITWGQLVVLGQDAISPGQEVWQITDAQGIPFSGQGDIANFDTSQMADGVASVVLYDISQVQNPNLANDHLEVVQVQVTNLTPPPAPTIPSPNPGFVPGNPGTPAPPPPAPPPGSAPQTIQLELSQNQLVSGFAILGACVTGGPNPNSHVGWQVDGAHAAGPMPSPTYDGTTRECYTIGWDSTTVFNGSHTLTANWWTQDGVFITTASVIINVQNGAPGPTPPPTTPPPTTPPPIVVCSQFTSPPAGDTLVGTITISLNSIRAPAEYANIYLQPIQQGAVGGTPTSPSWIATIPPNFAQFDSTTWGDGQYRMIARLFDGTAKLVCQTSINVTIQNHPQHTPPPTTPPPPPPVFVCPKITSPPDRDYLVGTVIISYDQIIAPAEYATVHITDAGGNDFYVAQLPPNFYQFDSTKFADGIYTLTLFVLDGTGKILCQPTIHVTIQNQKPPPPPPPPPPTPCPDLSALSSLTGSASVIAGVNTDPATFGQYNAPGGALNGVPLIGGPLLDNAVAAAKVQKTAVSTDMTGVNGAAIVAANNYYIGTAALDPAAYLALINLIRTQYVSPAGYQYFDRVDGACPINNPTTAEVLQWACNKWGINPLLGYGEALEETGWNQTAIGDNGLSVGILQVADANSAASPTHAFPQLLNLPTRVALLSTAYNADFWAWYIWSAFNGYQLPATKGNISLSIVSYNSFSNLAATAYVNAISLNIQTQAWLKLFQVGITPTVGAATLVICKQQPPQPPVTPPPPPPPVTPPPPTTCTDPCQQAIDADIQAINKSLQALTAALQSLPQPPAPVINVTPPAGTAPTVNVPPPDLTALSSALSTLAGCVCPALEDIAKAISTAAANPAPPPTIDLSGLIATIKEIYSSSPTNQQAIDEAASLGIINPGFAQASSSSATISWDPGRFHPKIAKWLKDSGVLGTPASDDLAGALARLFTSIFEWFKSAAFSVWPDLANAASGLASGVANNFGTIFNGAAALETDLPKLIFEWTLNNALPPGQVTADNVEDDAFKLLGGAFLVGQGVHLLAELAGYLKYPASSVWAHNAEMLIELLGYKEILRSFHGAFFPVAVRERARQRYNKAYAPYIANSNTAYEGFARGKITQTQRDALLNLNGRDVNYIDQEQQIRYRPISPFMLARGFRNRAPSPDILNGVITDQGITPQFHDLLEQIIIDSCYQNLEQGLENKVLAAAGKGTMTLDAATAQVQQLGWDDRAVNLVKQAALVDQQTFIVEEVRREVIDGIKSGGMTPDQGSGLLQAAGAAQWLIDHTIALANAEAAMRAAEKIESEELRTEHKTLNDTMAALEAQFLAGNLSLAGFTAAAEVAWFTLSNSYVQFGATEIQVASLQNLQQLSIAATVTRMQALKQGRVVNLFGLEKDRADAQLLTAQVNSIKEMYLRADTTLLATQSALQNLGISQDWITALTTRWDAQLQKKGSLAS